MAQDRVVRVSFLDHAELLWKYMYDPYQLFAETFHRYESAGVPISFYFPLFGDALLVYDPASLDKMSWLDTLPEPVIKKGFGTEYISKRFLGSGFAVLDTGELYRKIHSVMKPLFTQRSIETRMLMTQSWAQIFVEDMAERGKAEEYLNLEEEMLAFAMGAISRGMLNYPLTVDRAKELSHALSRILSGIAAEQVSFGKWFELRDSQSIEDITDMDIIQGFITELILHNETAPKEQRSAVITNVMALEDLGGQEKRDQILNIFFGGHETTAHWLTVCLYFLATYQDQQMLATMREEAFDFKQGTKPLAELTHIDAFMKESLRLDPSVPLYCREAIEDFDLNGHTVKAGTKIFILPYAAHRYQKNWENPTVFAPKRFLAPLKDPRAYIPFGVGPRGCMGRYFSAQEVKLFLVELLTRGEVELKEGTEPLASQLICTARLRQSLLGRLRFF